MTLKIASTTMDKPTGRKATGRSESKEWAELTQAILAQPEGQWVTYENFDQSTDAVRVGTRLRQKDNYAEGKAFAPLAGKVKVAIVDTGKNDSGKKIATLWIRYGDTPKAVRKSTKK